MRNRFSTLVLVSTMLSLACEVGVDPAELELDSDGQISDYTVEPTSQASSTLAEAIAAHADYPQLSAYAWNRTGQVFNAYASLDAELAEEESERLALCSQAASPGNCYDELSGIEVSFALSTAAKNAGGRIVADFGLQAMGVADREALFIAAQEAYVANGGPGGSLGMVPGTLAGGTTCDATCKADILDRMIVMQAGVVTAASTGDNGESSEGGAIWVAVATAAIVIVGQYVDCLFNPDCHPWPFTDPDDNECTHDSDCASDEYCWKGPLGVGANECRPKKANGKYCSRDGKCLSDCCKFNLWDFGSTCRPANQCN